MKWSRFALIVLALSSAVGIHAQEGSGNTTEKWRCFASSDYLEKTVLVNLTRVTVDGKVQGFGKVSVAGVDHAALFRVVGFERRWDFGKEFNFSFVISPDGRGLYYDFTSVEEGETTQPRQFYRCVSP